MFILSDFFLHIVNFKTRWDGIRNENIREREGGRVGTAVANLRHLV